MSLVGKNIGNYRIDGLLGEGGMGAVYRGVHPQIGKRVAVKVLKPELAADKGIVDRFFQEAKSVNDIGHPNIIDIVDFGRLQDDGHDVIYLVMEFLEGQSLSSRVKQGIPIHETVHILRQCCSGLAASHHKGIIHRDLKPENIYLIRRSDDKSFVKILDFGIAKISQNTGSKTRTGTVMGTPYYMSPEQCEGRGHIDARSDIYSLGVVMYELLTGQVPFTGEGFGQIIVAHLTQPPMPPSAIRACPAPLEAIVLRCLEKDPGRRFQSMGELEAALSDPDLYLAFAPPAGHGRADAATMMGPGTPLKRTTTLSGAASESQQVPREGGSRGGMVWGSLALLAALGGGGYYAMTSRGASTPAASVTAPSQDKATRAPADADQVQISFASTPSGAKVSRADGEVLGTTPFEKTFKRGEPIDVAFILSGHVRSTRSISTDKNREVMVSLIAEAPAAAPAKPAVASKPKAPRPARSPKKIVGAEDDMSLLKSSILEDK